MGQPVWKLDPHTKAKHVILRKYLDAWLPKLTSWNGRVVICDGFAGPGIYSKGEEGSPVIALKAYLEHSYRQKMKGEIEYLFIESDKKRFQSLSSIIGHMELPTSVHVRLINDEYEKAFREILDRLDEHASRIAPTFAFIDPFGVRGVPLQVIERLMAHQSCEVFITFMISALLRFVSTPEFESHCDRLYGSAEWRVARGLLGVDRERYLRTFYQRQLVDHVGSKYVRFFTMKDTSNKPIYDLFFATNNKHGIDAMKDAMWNVDQSGGYSFSDATDPDQVTMFTSEPDWEQLFNIMAEQFAGETIRWPIAEEAIRRTPFRILKRPLQAESKKENSRFVIINPGGVRRGTLDKHTRIRFPD